MINVLWLYYAILGVTANSENVVIAAAYKALGKKYHPDVWTGKKEEADEKIRKINEAYSVLKDPQKRKAYDNSQSDKDNTGNYEDHSHGEEDNFSDELEGWKLVVEYYPRAEVLRKELSLISKKTAQYYQLAILTLKCADKHEELAVNVKEKFMVQYFGPNVQLQKFVLMLLKKGLKKDALEINKAIKTLGPESSDAILESAQKNLYEKERSARESAIQRQEEIRKKSEAERNKSDENLKIHCGYSYDIDEKSGILIVTSQPPDDVLPTAVGTQYENLGQLKFLINERIRTLEYMSRTKWRTVWKHIQVL